MFTSKLLYSSNFVVTRPENYQISPNDKLDIYKSNQDGSIDVNNLLTIKTDGTTE
jgi:hypothetical protein